MFSWFSLILWFLHCPIGYTGLPWWLSSKESAYQARDLGSIPGSKRSPRERNGSSLQCFCLGNPMDIGAWWAAVHGVTEVLWHAAAAKPLQSCPTLCDPRNGSPPGSPVPGILQARTLEWVAISFSSQLVNHDDCSSLPNSSRYVACSQGQHVRRTPGWPRWSSLPSGLGKSQVDCSWEIVMCDSL